MKLDPEKVGVWLCYCGFVMLCWVMMLPPAYAIERVVHRATMTCPAGYLDGIRYDGLCMHWTGGAHTTSPPAVDGYLVEAAITCDADYAFFQVYRANSLLGGHCSKGADTPAGWGPSLAITAPAAKSQIYIHEAFCPIASSSGIQASPTNGVGCLNASGTLVYQAATTVLDAALVKVSVTCPNFPLLTVTVISAHQAAGGMSGSCGYSDGSYLSPLTSSVVAEPRKDTLIVRIALSIAGVLVFLCGYITGWKLSVKPPQLIMD